MSVDPAEFADSLPEDQTLPFVSIIVPCYNEADTIHLLLDAIYRQTYPKSRLEVIIADGLSTDNTREEIESFRLNHLDLEIRLVDNPQRTIPAGLNRALRAAQGEMIVRLDAHSMPKAEYVQFCVEDLRGCLGDNVGGVWEIMPRGDGAEARAIAYSAAHPLAVGDARYRYASQAQLTDTVPFGAYRRSLIDRVGFYNETLLTNEDYELNARVRQTGGKIYLDPADTLGIFCPTKLYCPGPPILALWILESADDSPEPADVTLAAAAASIIFTGHHYWGYPGILAAFCLVVTAVWSY